MATDDYGVSLADFAQDKTQPKVAELIRVTQSAVSQMMNSDRQIRVRRLPDGNYQAFEIKPVGGRVKAA